MVHRRILITGMNGTVAPALAAEIRARGGQVVAWDRSAVPPNDDSAVEEHIRTCEASALVHCAVGSPWHVRTTQDLRMNTMVLDERMPNVSIAARLPEG